MRIRARSAADVDACMALMRQTHLLEDIRASGDPTRLPSWSWRRRPRAGISRRLLATATANAHSQHQRPLLDVMRADLGPVRLYESMGWERLEPLTPLENGRELAMWVYLGPAPPPADETTSAP